MYFAALVRKIFLYARLNHCNFNWALRVSGGTLQSFFQGLSTRPSFLDWFREKNPSRDPDIEMLYQKTLLIGIGIALLAFGCVKSLLFSGLITKHNALLTTILSLLIGLSGSWLRASELTLPARIIYRTTAVLFGFYLIASHVPIPEGARLSQASWFQYGPLLGLVCAFAAFWRPSLALVTYACVFIHKILVSQIWDIAITRTNYVPVAESSAFLVLGAMAIVWCRKIIARQNNLEMERIEAGKLPLLDALVIFVVGMHFANYFFSALAKLRLQGGGLLAWPLENPTNALFEVAKDAGFFTVGYGFSFSDKLEEWFPSLLPLINWGTLISQLACVFVFWRRWTIVAITAAYDLQHVVIFLLTGIFFWQWIILNTALVFAIHKIKFERIPLRVGMLGCFACISIGFTGNLFFVGKLGWYDTASYNRLRVFAVTENGSEHEIPSTFFGPLSVTVAQMRVKSDLPQGFPTGTWGTSKQYSMLKRGLKCELDINDKPGKPARGLQLERLTRLWHGAILTKLDTNGLLSYDWYPHHVWNDPWRYDDFKNLDKRKIVAYRWIRDAVCIDLNATPPQARTVAHFEKLVRINNQ